jgi:hypothetical protein
VKINWDVAVDRERGKIEMGIIARDHSGRVLVMRSAPKQWVNEPLLAEALATREAIELGNSLRLNVCILEGDSLEMVSAINHVEPCRGHMGKLLMISRSHWRKEAIGR